MAAKQVAKGQIAFAPLLDTVFYECEGGMGIACLNPLTVKHVTTDSDDDEEE